MKKQFYCMVAALTLVLALSACGAPASQDSLPPASSGDTSSSENALSLGDIYGDTYVSLLTETLTMQMENRMDKTPEQVYYPVEEQKPLSDYVDIGEETAFYINEEGNTVVVLPAGSVTDAANGTQEFIIAKP